MSNNEKLFDKSKEKNNNKMILEHTFHCILYINISI